MKQDAEAAWIKLQASLPEPMREQAAFVYDHIGCPAVPSYVVHVFSWKTAK